jgi:hypothetical protein
MKNFIYSIILLSTSISLHAQTQNSLDDNRKIKIPVVFHIVYSSPQESIDVSLIIRELQDLNLDFSNVNDKSALDSDFKMLVGKANIEFFLLDTSCNRFRAILSSKDDGIDDTPKQFKCTDLSFSKTCPPKKNIYYKGHKILYNNFMDYSGCRCMFTVGQSIKMRNNIIESKPLLFN